ncbi:hypothetical protein PENANT_c004G04642 [Penicillium antarcticum]|uniref:Uncharacterized protein n=1 Tax=Penicillium antarcticum TaxID=416450 RepID=A0A1V6QHH5_9EURO|nr:uncharacterized protein N7508_002538 [Penicillium antarcticum]KAJ5318030.1 hypothetical protein N7508_002538 [Penicillium antarcticum]OQD88407.1 hypothetical protein PENANT_c004G04642 [Penicillium antarcticum]
MSNGTAVALLDGVDAWPHVPAEEDQSPSAQVQPVDLEQEQSGAQNPPSHGGLSFKPHPYMPIPSGKPMWPPAPEVMPAGLSHMSEYSPHHKEITVIDVVEYFSPMSVEVNQRPTPPVGGIWEARHW